MIKNRMQLVRFELAFLHQVHHARDASERERPIGHERDRGVKFQPRICRQLHWVTNVNWRDERKDLQQDHQRRGEGAHQREAIGWAH